MIEGPFRYPGSKRRFSRFFPLFIEDNGLAGSNLIETHAGSAAVALNSVAHGLISSAILVERDPLVHSVWYSIFNFRDQLIERIQTTTPSIDAWTAAREFLGQAFSYERVVEFAMAGLILNRCSFSGILTAGPIGGRAQTSAYSIGCRFNKEALVQSVVKINRLRDRVSPLLSDAVTVIKRTKKRGSVLYIDPPYHKNGHKFYRHSYDEAAHLSLRDCLSDTHAPWLLSYDASGYIKDLYADFSQVELRWYQSAKSPRVETELLVSNVNLGRLSDQARRSDGQLVLDLNLKAEEVRMKTDARPAVP